MGICGEGEEPFRLLLERIERKQPLVRRTGALRERKGASGDSDVSSGTSTGFPFLSGGLLAPAGGAEATLPVQTRRGCPLGCSYCSTASIEGRAIRRRSPKKVVEWIARWTEEQVHRLYFVDNTFNLPASYAKDLCRELAAAARGVSWRCIVYPFRMEEGLAALMAEAGCEEASVGFESGCERILRTMNKRFGLDDITRTRVVLRKFGIRCMGFLLLGGPGRRGIRWRRALPLPTPSIWTLKGDDRHSYLSRDPAGRAREKGRGDRSRGRPPVSPVLPGAGAGRLGQGDCGRLRRKQAELDPREVGRA